MKMKLSTSTKKYKIILVDLIRIVLVLQAALKAQEAEPIYPNKEK